VVIDDAAIKWRYASLGPYLDERGGRLFAAAEALTAGWGGIATVSRITGIARSTIGRERRLRRPIVSAEPARDVRRWWWRTRRC